MKTYIVFIVLINCVFYTGIAKGYEYSLNEIVIIEKLNSQNVCCMTDADNSLNNRLTLLKKEIIPIYLEAMNLADNSTFNGSTKISSYIESLHSLAKEGIFNYDEVPFLIRTLKEDNGYNFFAADTLRLITGINTNYTEDFAKSINESNKSAYLLKINLWEKWWKSKKEELIYEKLSAINFIPITFEYSNNAFVPGDEEYNKILRYGDEAIPFLINAINNTTPSNITPDVDSFKDYKIGDVAFLLLVEITGLPFDYFFPEEMKIGINGIPIILLQDENKYLKYLKNNDNRKLFQKKWFEWYKKRETRYSDKNVVLPKLSSIPEDLPLVYKRLIRRLYYINSDERLKATKLLGDEKWKEAYKAVPFLIPLLNDKDVFVRENTAIALGEIGDRKAVASLIIALDDNSWSVRAASAIALGKLKDKSAVEDLIMHIDDKVIRVRINVCWALGEIGDLRAKESLKKIINKETGMITNKAKEAVEKIEKGIKTQ